MQFKYYLPLIAALTLVATGAEAHSGRTNSSGCHNNRKTGSYHCHNSGSSGSSGGSRSSGSSSGSYSKPTPPQRQSSPPVNPSCQGVPKVSKPWALAKPVLMGDAKSSYYYKSVVAAGNSETVQKFLDCHNLTVKFRADYSSYRRIWAACQEITAPTASQSQTVCVAINSSNQALDKNIFDKDYRQTVSQKVFGTPSTASTRTNAVQVAHLTDFTLKSESGDTRIKFNDAAFETTGECVTTPYTTESFEQLIKGEMCLRSNGTLKSLGTFSDLNTETNEGCKGRASIDHAGGTKYIAAWVVDGSLAGYGTCKTIGQSFEVEMFGASRSAGPVATVLSVGDGDTLTVTQNGQKMTIRVACVDAPEMRQAPYGERSKARLLQLAPVDSEIRVDAKETDRYGRTVAEVFNGDLNLGLALVQEGQAVAYRQYLSNCEGAAYLAAEQQAQNSQKAFWGQANPVMPWDYRRGVRPQTVQPQSQTQNTSQRCDPNYSGACIQPYSQGDVDCGEISARRFRSIGSDPHRLDGDKDGIACESR